MKKYEHKILIFKIDAKDFTQMMDAARSLKESLNNTGNEGYRIASSVYDQKTNIQIAVLERKVRKDVFVKILKILMKLPHRIKNKIDLYVRKHEA